MTTIKSVFEDVSKDIVVDTKFIQRVHEFERSIVNFNEDHIEFFGGTLFGVKPMRFRNSDRDRWFTDVIEMDDLDLEDGIAKVPTIDVNWKRANDVFNLSCVWAVYAIYNSKKLNEKQKHQGMVDTLLVLQYKFLGSLLAHYFKFPADEATMLKVYATLNYKYAIKSAGSVHQMLLNRCNDILSPRSIHRKAYTTLEGDVIYMVNDIQGRLREIIKGIWKVFAQIRESGARIGTEKSVLDIDGSSVLLDKMKAQPAYIRYINEVITDKKSFIRQELVDVIANAMHTMPPNQLIEALEWMSLNHRTKEGELIEEFVNETMIYAFELMGQNRSMMNSGGAMSALIQKLRALYRASRMAHPSLIKTRDLADVIVKKSIKSKNPSVIAAVRTGLQLYIVLRTLTKSYYTA